MMQTSYILCQFRIMREFLKSVRHESEGSLKVQYRTVSFYSYKNLKLGFAPHLSHITAAEMDATQKADSFD